MIDEFNGFVDRPTCDSAAGQQQMRSLPDPARAKALFNGFVEQCLRAGRIWQRAHLLLTSRGVAGRPINEAVELIDHERLRNQEPLSSAQLAELTHDGTWQPTFMFRVGFPIRPALASPRRPIEDVII